VDIVCTLHGLSKQEFGFNVVDISGQVCESTDLVAVTLRDAFERFGCSIRMLTSTQIHYVLPKCIRSFIGVSFPPDIDRAPGEPGPPCQVASNDEMEVSYPKSSNCVKTRAQETIRPPPGNVYVAARDLLVRWPRIGGKSA